MFVARMPTQRAHVGNGQLRSRVSSDVDFEMSNSPPKQLMTAELLRCWCVNPPFFSTASLHITWNGLRKPPSALLSGLVLPMTATTIYVNSASARRNKASVSTELKLSTVVVNHSAAPKSRITSGMFL